MGAERNQESLTKGRQQKHLNIWLCYTHSNCTQLLAHTEGWDQNSREDLRLGVLFTAAIKNWAQEQRSETLQASQKPECWKLENKRKIDARCRTDEEHMGKLRNKIKRDRWTLAIQEDCTHGRSVSVLCHPANTWNLSESSNLSSTI